MKKRIIKRKIYDVDCLTSDGFCYSTHLGVPYDKVKLYRKTANALGETFIATYAYTFEY